MSYIYTIASRIKDKSGRELKRLEQRFEADSEREAMSQAHQGLQEYAESLPAADVISSTIRCVETGSTSQTSDYVEDLSSGASQSGLLEELERPDAAQAQAEQEALQRDAVDAVLSEDQKRTLVGDALVGGQTGAQDEPDPIKDFFGGERPSERLKRAGGVPVGTDTFPSVGRSGDQDGGEHPQGQAGNGGPVRSATAGADPSPGTHGGDPPGILPGVCDKTFATCRDRFRNEKRYGGSVVLDQLGGRSQVTPCPYVFGDRSCGVRPAGQPQSNNSGGASCSGGQAANAQRGRGPVAGGVSGGLQNRNSDAQRKSIGRKLLDDMIESSERLEQVTGRRAASITVNPEHAKYIGKALGLPDGASVDGGVFKGLPISVDYTLPDDASPGIVTVDSSGIFRAPSPGHLSYKGSSGQIFMAPLGPDGRPNGPFRHTGAVPNFNLPIGDQDEHKIDPVQWKGLVNRHYQKMMTRKSKESE